MSQQSALGDNNRGTADTGDVDRLVGRLKTLAGVIAPTTVLSALLLYFGYVATLARFEYFGVSVDLLDLPTRQLLLYGVEVVYVPLALVGIGMLVGFSVHGAAMILLSNPVRSRRAGPWPSVIMILAGVLLLIRALVGILNPSLAIREVPGTTPLSLVVGNFLITYGAWLARRSAAEHDTPEKAAGRWHQSRRLVRNWLTVTALLTVAGLFWAANSFASAYGRGRALDDAEDLVHRPEVIIFTSHRLHDLPPQTLVTETMLPGSGSEPTQYRYRGLRLLVANHDRLFLIPAPWTTTSWALAIPYGSDLGIRLVPR